MQHKTDIDPAPLLASARRFHRGFQFAYLVSVTVAGAVLIGLLLAPVWTGATLSEAVGYPLPASRFWQSAALTLIVVGMLVTYALVFFSAATVCSALADGDVEHAALGARSLSNWLWTLLALSILANTAAILVATAHAEPGQRVLSITFGSEQITVAIAALIAAFLARAFVLGAALWRDHREII